MKKLLSIAFIGLALSLSAQITTPRFGTTGNKDNTGRVLTLAYITPSFASSYAIVANASKTFVKMAELTGAQTLTATVTKCQVGDELHVMFLCDTLTAGRVVTFSTNLKASGTLTVAKNKRAAIHFVFDGTYWVATGREKE